MRAFLRKLFPSWISRPSPDTRARTYLNELRTAIGTYSQDIGTLPRSLEDLCADLTEDDSWNGPYIAPRGSDTFLDPWGYEYQYRTDGMKFELESKGLMGYDRDYG